MCEIRVCRPFKYFLFCRSLQPRAHFSRQPFDLTELDWSPEIWVAVHDDDEQNARLALRVWEDNGLDVPEHFLQKLMDLLGWLD